MRLLLAADLVREIIVDASPMTEGVDPEEPLTSIDLVHDPEAPDTVFPQPLQLPHQWLPEGGLGRKASRGRLDAAFQVGRKMSNDVGDVGRDLESGQRHRRRRLRGGVSGSPNTSSKVSFRLPEP